MLSGKFLTEDAHLFAVKPHGEETTIEMTMEAKLRDFIPEASYIEEGDRAGEALLQALGLQSLDDRQRRLGRVALSRQTYRVGAKE